MRFVECMLDLILEAALRKQTENRTMVVLISMVNSVRSRLVKLWPCPGGILLTCALRPSAGKLRDITDSSHRHAGEHAWAIRIHHCS